ncbi:hypothetical protein JHK85_028222 [Glycine max]|nr:hypothetical protein JHK85_028222 [Glycine max]
MGRSCFVFLMMLMMSRPSGIRLCGWTLKNPPLMSKLKHLLKLWTTLLYVGSSFTNNGVMNETPEESNAAIVDEVEHTVIELASKLSTTSNEATSRGKGEPDVVIIYSTSLGPTPLNYAQPAIVTRDQVQDMIGQAMETFVERQH